MKACRSALFRHMAIARAARRRVVCLWRGDDDDCAVTRAVAFYARDKGQYADIGPAGGISLLTAPFEVLLALRRRACHLSAGSRGRARACSSIIERKYQVTAYASIPKVKYKRRENAISNLISVHAPSRMRGLSCVGGIAAA